jgi:predicted RNA binding protein YcfA (HicA-like mRNA interferase family)
MANYKFKDIVKALNAANFFEVNNNGGSHQVYKNFELGLSQPVPRHAGDNIATGTAESILDWVVLAARIQNINIVRDKYKLSDEAKSYIIKRHAEIKANPISLIPADVRKQRHIDTIKDGQKYLDELAEKHKVIAKNKQQNFDK